MPKQERVNEEGVVSRRQFLKNTGIVVGGTAIGASLLVSACGGEGTTKTVKVTTSVTKFVCPYDSREFDTFAALQEHVEAEHQAGDPIAKFVCPYDNQEFRTLAELKTHLDEQHITATTGSPDIIILRVNNKEYLLKVEPYWTLSFVIRNKLGLMATKEGCNLGECGTCTVLIDGKTVYSCLVLAVDAQGKDIQTLEGMSDGINLHPIQQSFLEHNSHQCGYCTPGVIMSVKALLDKNSNPNRDEIREALSGNLCICGSNRKVIEAVLDIPRRL